MIARKVYDEALIGISWSDFTGFRFPQGLRPALAVMCCLAEYIAHSLLKTSHRSANQDGHNVGHEVQPRGQ